jgi:hypothetical protein
VFGAITDIHKTVLGDFQYPWGSARILEIIKQMVQSRKTPAELEDMIEAIAVIEAFREARSTKCATRVANFL